MTEEQRLKIGEWLNERGYDLDLQDDFWMEDYLGDHKFRDLCDLLHEYAEEKLKHLVILSSRSMRNKWKNSLGTQ